jgi:hypothetical protein
VAAGGARREDDARRAILASDDEDGMLVVGWRCVVVVVRQAKSLLAPLRPVALGRALVGSLGRSADTPPLSLTRPSDDQQPT